MGNPKQKWTSDEEEALRAGVKKHGTGKWKDIQKDPEFNPFLSARSNIDLKDKWRNMTVSGLGTRKKVNPDSSPAPLSVAQGSTPTPVRRDGPSLVQVKCDPDATPVRRNAPATVPVRHDTPAAAPVADDSSTGLSDSITAQMYNAMIFEALSTSTDPNGMDTGAISSFIEQRTEVPQNFRRSLTTRLRKLVAQDKLEKVQNCFKCKVKTEPSCGTKAPTPKQDTPPRQMQLLGGRAAAPKHKDIQPRQMQIPGYVIPGDTIEESAMSAASKIAEAENKSLLAAEKVKEADLFSQKAEETEAGLQLARDILELCSEGDVMLME